MRTDFSNNFRLKMVEPYREPYQVAVFNFPKQGKVRISDKDRTVSGVQFLGLVEDWGVLRDSGDPTRETGETMEMSISIINAGLTPFSDYFLYDDPENVQVDVYQLFEGLGTGDMALIDSFVIQDPIRFNEAGVILTLDLVSRNLRYDGPVGKLVNVADYPLARPEDIGKGLDLIVGEPGQVPCPCIQAGLSATLRGSIAKKSTVIQVNEDLVRTEWPQTGKILIESEIIRYSSIVKDLQSGICSFRVWSNGGNSGRGYDGTVAADHGDNEELTQVIPYVFAVGQRPLASIGSVFLDGKFLADQSFSPYTVSVGTWPPKITFAKVPQYKTFAKSSQTWEHPISDIVYPDTTAFEPAKSFDLKEGTASIISDATNFHAIPAGKVLALRTYNLSTMGPGLIVSAAVKVSHWPAFYYSQDKVQVWWGSTYLGDLTRPNPRDVIDFNEFWDLTHPHDHDTSGDHTHSVQQPWFDNTSNPHGHQLDGTEKKDVEASVHYRSFNWGENPIGTQTTWYDLGSIQFVCSIPSGWSQGDIQTTSFFISARTVGCRAQYSFYGSPMYQESDTTWSEHEIIWTDGWLSGFILRAYSYGAVGAMVRMDNARCVAHFARTADMTKVAVQVNTTQTVSTANFNNTDKQITDVKRADTNAPLDGSPPEPLEVQIDLTQLQPGRTYEDTFDLTDGTGIPDMASFLGKTVKLVYVPKVAGNPEHALVMVQEVRVELTYRPVEVRQTLDVSCVPVALDANRPDKVIQLLLNKAGLPDNQMGSVGAVLPEWNDAAVWADSDLWKDGGEAMTELLDTPFDTAGAMYSALAPPVGYRLDGVISAKENIRDAIKDICRQVHSRLIWTGGKAKLAVVTLPENWVDQNRLTTADVQLKSISVSRQPASETINDLRVHYQLDNYLGAYRQLRVRPDVASQGKHGVRTSHWDFPLVRNDTVAEALADFFIAQRANPSTFYEVTAYLPNMDTEKTDVVNVSSRLAGLRGGRAMMVRGVSRVFGSGKLRRINQVRLVCESLNWTQLKLTLQDTVRARDTRILVTDAIFLDDHAHATDQLDFSWTRVGLQDQVTVTDDNDRVQEMDKALADSVALQDQLGLHFRLVMEDTVLAVEVWKFWEDYGFALDGFGLGGFGGQNQMRDALVDVIRPRDTIAITFN